MNTLSYEYQGVTVTVTEPLAKHRYIAEKYRGQLTRGWMLETGKETEEISEVEWSLIYHYAELATPIVGVAGELPFPLPWGDALLASNSYLVMEQFWDACPPDFVDLHEKTVNSFGIDLDPNV
jgi:hypothetical protein